MFGFAQPEWCSRSDFLSVPMPERLAGSIAFGQTVTFDFDKAADFSKFKTVDSELARKGFVSVDADGGPDVLVAYRVSFERDAS